MPSPGSCRGSWMMLMNQQMLWTVKWALWRASWGRWFLSRSSFCSAWYFTLVRLSIEPLLKGSYICWCLWWSNYLGSCSLFSDLCSLFFFCIHLGLSFNKNFLLVWSTYSLTVFSPDVTYLTTCGSPGITLAWEVTMRWTCSLKLLSLQLSEHRKRGNYH